MRLFTASMYSIDQHEPSHPLRGGAADPLSPLIAVRAEDDLEQVLVAVARPELLAGEEDPEELEQPLMLVAAQPERDMACSYGDYFVAYGDLFVWFTEVKLPEGYRLVRAC